MIIVPVNNSVVVNCDKVKSCRAIQHACTAAQVSCVCSVCSSTHRHHHHQITKLSHSINAIGPAPHRDGRKREHRSIMFATITHIPSLHKIQHTPSVKQRPVCMPKPAGCREPRTAQHHCRALRMPPGTSPHPTRDRTWSPITNNRVMLLKGVRPWGSLDSKSQHPVHCCEVPIQIRWLKPLSLLRR
jgi:hypothetical protein